MCYQAPTCPTVYSGHWDASGNGCSSIPILRVFIPTGMLCLWHTSQVKIHGKLIRYLKNFDIYQNIFKCRQQTLSREVNNRWGSSVGNGTRFVCYRGFLQRFLAPLTLILLPPGSRAVSWAAPCLYMTTIRNWDLLIDRILKILWKFFRFGSFPSPFSVALLFLYLQLCHKGILTSR